MASKAIATVLEVGLVALILGGLPIGLYMLLFPAKALLSGHQTRWPGLMIVGFYGLLFYLFYLFYSGGGR